MHALDPILRPRSIAVIGASRQPNTIGWHILDNLLRAGFQGPVYPVNPKATAIHSIPAYPTVQAIGAPVDLAVIVVPKEHVLQVAEQCLEAGVRGLVVISAGFREVGGAGIERERQLLDLVRRHGVRMVGPNCMGVMNTAEDVRMNATFAPSTPPRGPVAFMSQSGAMGLSVLDYAESLNIGISMFVSAGNKADLSGNDFLEYWRDDPATNVILMYLENFGNPARFVELARGITRTKPICVVKSGRTGAGARAAASHTGALAGTELATEAIIAQSGAIRAHTVEDLFDLAMAFANQPLPEGNRVAVVTNAGGPGIILADACEANGLSVVPLAAETQARLRARLPEEASVGNPVDLIASATPASYEFALSAVFGDPNVDAAIAAFVPPLGIQAKDVAEAIVRVNAQYPHKPLLAVLMGLQGLPAGLAQLHEANVPAYIFPESAARALGAMWLQRQRRDRPEGRIPSFKTDDAAVESILDAAARAGQTRLSEPDALRVLEAYDIPVSPWTFVSQTGGESLASAASAAARKLGFPVAIKIVSPEIVHKTDVGGVVLDLDSEEAVGRAVRSMIRRASPAAAERSRIDGILVQQMAPKGRETIVGLTRMPRVGPLVMFGLGGVYVEVLRDVVLRLAPLRDCDAEEMIREVKMHRLLAGVRGEPPRDLKALTTTLLRVSQLAQRHPRIAELDINPLLSLEKGAVAVDARVQLATPGEEGQGEAKRAEGR
ncbi:MAG TPA: acetate--CoA ligase family protein [Gemmatimonadales bacterium]|nr:acetate--CoA ligase family protein [Gemmatimonadales bacterium]